MLFKIYNAFDIYNVVHQDINKQLATFGEDFLGKNWLFDIFIAKKQTNVPDFVVIVTQKEQIIGTFTIYLCLDQLFIDNVGISIDDNEIFIYFIQKMYEFLLDNFLSYKCQHNFDKLDVEFRVNTTIHLCDISQESLLNVNFSNDTSIWNNCKVKDNMIYCNGRLEPNQLAYCRIFNANYEEYISDQEEINVEYGEESCVEDILDDLELELSLEQSQSTSKAQQNARKNNLILAKSKLSSTIFPDLDIGCFATTIKEPNEEICAFFGTLINESTRQKLSNKKSGFWCINIAKDEFLVPSDDCCANYINSPWKCIDDNGKPIQKNAKLIVSQRLKQVRVTAIKKIQIGEEIVMGYGKSFNFNPIVEKIQSN